MNIVNHFNFRKQSLRFFWKKLLSKDDAELEVSFFNFFIVQIQGYFQLIEIPLCFVTDLKNNIIEKFPLKTNRFIAKDLSWLKYLRHLQSKEVFKNKEWKAESSIASLFKESSNFFTVALLYKSHSQKVWFIFNFETQPSFRSIENLGKICQKAVHYQEQKKIWMNHFLNQKIKNQQQAIDLLLHQIKTPLLEISSVFKDLSLLNLKNTHHLIETGKNQMKSLKQRIDSYLDIVKVDHSILMQSLSLKKIIEDCITVFSFLIIHKKIKIEWNLKEDILVKVNRSLVHQVLENIIQNSLDELNSFISGNNVQFIKVNCMRKENKVQIQIFDSGKGVSYNNREKIFDPFFSSKLCGHGLGLFFCRKAMNVMCGEIFYHCSDILAEKGFWLTLNTDEL